MPLGTLLGELEEFCSISPKTFLLLLKHRGPGVLPLTSPPNPKTAAGAALVGEREQPSPPSLQRGKSGCPPFLAGSLSKWGKPEEVTTLPWFSLFLWASAVARVASRVGREDLCDGRRLAQGSEEDARGAAKVQREQL